LDEIGYEQFANLNAKDLSKQVFDLIDQELKNLQAQGM